MKTLRTLTLIFAVMIVSTAFSQRETARGEKVKKREDTSKIEKTTRKVNDVNKTLTTSTDSITNTIEETKNTAKKLKEVIFGNSKHKKEKENKGVVTILVPNVAYGDKSIDELYNTLDKLKEVKGIQRNYNNQNITISIDSNKSADTLWQCIQESLQHLFVVKEMSEKKMLLNLADAD
jgi:predicted RNase H-like nuclease (RuvC/YqgF family)